MDCEKCVWYRTTPYERCMMRMDMDNAIYHCPHYEGKVFPQAAVIGSVCGNRNHKWWGLTDGTEVCTVCGAKRL